MSMVGMCFDVMVMRCVIETNEFVVGLPVKRVLSLREPDVEKSVVDEEHPKVSWGISRPTLDNDVCHESWILSERDVSEGFVRR